MCTIGESIYIQYSKYENRRDIFILVISIALVALLTSGCSTALPALNPTPTTLPTITPAPTFTVQPTPTSTLTPLPTARPKPTSTPTLVPIPTAIPVPTQIPQVEEISLTTKDGARLAATLFLAQGDIAVVLAHMGIVDQRSWKSFAKTIASRGYTAITFDFRCYGQSECVGGAGDTLATDVRAAVERLRQQGYERVVCMGASMGGQACMSAALDEELAGLVVIASPAVVRTDKHFPEDLASPAMPKLFIVADRDRYSDLTLVIPDLYESAPAPKDLVTFPSLVHGTELFQTEHGNSFRNLLLNFLDGLAH